MFFKLRRKMALKIMLLFFIKNIFERSSWSYLYEVFKILFISCDSSIELEHFWKKSKLCWNYHIFSRALTRTKNAFWGNFFQLITLILYNYIKLAGMYPLYNGFRGYLYFCKLKKNQRKGLLSPKHLVKYILSILT